MKLISCQIENFGVLVKFTYNFESGLNVIHQPNGWGKSTFTAFLKAMFYGLPSNNQKSAIQNERKRYMPWQGGTFGGEITFEADGKVYKVTRIFGKKQSEDIFQLIDMSTNLPSDDYSASLGEELFGIDEESFARSIFVKENDVITHATDGINAKISDVSSDSNVISNYDKAMLLLKNKLNEMSPDRKTGAINKAMNQASGMKVEILENEKIDAEIAKATEQLQASMQDKNETTKALMMIQNERDNLAKLKSDADVVSLTPDEQNEYKKLSKRLADIDGMTLEDIDDTIAYIEKKRKKKPVLVLCIFLALGFFAAAAFAYLGMNLKERLGMNVFLAVEGALIISGIIMLIAGMLGSRVRANESEELIFEFVKVYAEKYMKGSTDYLAVAYDVSARFERLIALNEKNEEFKIKNEVFTKSRDEVAKRLGNMGFYASTDINQQIQYLSDRKDRATSKCIEYRQYLDELSEKKAHIVDKKNKLSELEEKTAEERHTFELYKKTRELLERAKEQYTAKYMDPILEGFRKYYMILAGDRGYDFSIDANMNITVKEQGLARDTALLSAGYRDMTGLCTRMALADAMYKKEKPFVVFDDPFTMLDEDHLMGALSFIDELSNEYQVIYLVCNENRIG